MLLPSARSAQKHMQTKQTVWKNLHFKFCCMDDVKFIFAIFHISFTYDALRRVTVFKFINSAYSSIYFYKT